MRLGWNRAEDGVITVYAHAENGRAAPVADFWLQPIVDKLGITRADAKALQEKFADLLVKNSAAPIPHAKIVECVARRLLSEMEDHGGVDEFCEKLTSFPEQYLTDLATGAIDCISLSGCLSPRVEY